MIGYLLHGILYADGISTVSPTYAREIQTPLHGAGLQDLLAARSSRLVGILNGVDYDEWSPAVDKHIAAHYDADSLPKKELNKQALLQRVGLPYSPAAPVFGIVSRMASQKGFQLCPNVLAKLLGNVDCRLVVLGSGEKRLELIFQELARRFPGKARLATGYNEDLAHLIEAGSDFFLMPSRYEPCGLNQMYSLRYGTPPIVHRTGGLADTVELWNPRTGQGTGFPFEHFDEAGLEWAILEALSVFQDRRALTRLRQNGMAMDFSWAHQAKLYAELYGRLQKL
jgi:starch synthase